MRKPVIDCRALEYTSLKEAYKRLIPQLTPQWTGYNDADPGMVILDLLAATGDMFGYMMDKRTNELFPTRARSGQSQRDLGRTYDYRLRRISAATVNISVAKKPGVGVLVDPITIPQFTKFATVSGKSFITRETVTLTEESFTSHDEVRLYTLGETLEITELVDAAGNYVWVTDPEGYATVTAYEGTLHTEGIAPSQNLFVATGEAQQSFTLTSKSVASNFMIVTVIGQTSVIWQEDVFLPSSVAQDSQQRYFIEVAEDGTVTLNFSNALFDVPEDGEQIRVDYLVTEGVVGDIPVSDVMGIDTSDGSASLNTSFTFNNLTESFGSEEAQLPESVGQDIPKYLSTLWRSVTRWDHDNIALTYPGVLGVTSVPKDLATVAVPLDGGGTVQATRFVVDVFILSNDTSSDFYASVATFMSNYTMLGVYADVKAAEAVPVSLSVSIIADHGFSNAQVALDVEAALRAFFAIPNQTIGGTLYVDAVFNVISEVRGVRNYILNSLHKTADSASSTLSHITTQSELGEYISLSTEVGALTVIVTGGLGG